MELGAEVSSPDGGGWPLPGGRRMRVWLARVVAGEPAPLQDHDLLRVLGPTQWLDVAWLDPDVPLVGALVALAHAASATREPADG